MTGGLKLVRIQIAGSTAALVATAGLLRCALLPSEPAHPMVSAVRVRATGYARENSELFLPQAELEVEMFRADLEYREALTELKALMRER